MLQYSKEQYSKYIKEKVQNAAFKEYMMLKQSCKNKLESVQYSNL